MCELLGMSFNHPVNMNVSFRGMIKRGDKNPDGWGLAFYPEDSKASQIIKEPVRAGRSPVTNFLVNYQGILSSLYISHVRWATSEVNYANTHPFVRELRGRDYVFAHNGTLHDFKRALPLGRFVPLGTTDSEHAFCYLMDYIANEISQWDYQAFARFEEVLRKVNELGKFNCLLSNGDYLFCYRDIDASVGLYYTLRKAPFGVVKLIDEDLNIDLDAMKRADEVGCIVATRPLTEGEDWKPIGRGQLMVFHRGEQVYPETTEISKETMIRALRFIRTSPSRVDVFAIANAAGIKIWKIAPLIDKLVQAGYIRQDSRDTGGPYKINSTYYTVPAKRREIDEMLEEDRINSEIPLSEVLDACSAADPDDRTLMCMRCFRAYKEGYSHCRYCLGSLEAVDSRLIDILYELNRKGYPTAYSCGGHANNQFQMYIQFNRTIELEPPQNFALENGNRGTIIRSILYHKAKGLRTKKAREAITLEELEAYALENLDHLRAWARMLPERQLKSPNSHMQEGMAVNDGLQVYRRGGIRMSETGKSTIITIRCNKCGEKSIYKASESEHLKCKNCKSEDVRIIRNPF